MNYKYILYFIINLTMIFDYTQNARNSILKIFFNAAFFYHAYRIIAFTKNKLKA